MSVDVVIKNGKIVTSYGIFDADIGINDGKIMAIGKKILQNGNEIIDASGKLIFPGVIDIHVHIYDTGSVEEGTKEAALGGVTTVIDLPPTEPQIMDIKSFEEKKKKFSQDTIIDFGLCAGEIYYEYHMIHIKELIDAGVSYFKIFMPGPPPVSSDVIYMALETASRDNALIAIHAENMAIVNMFTDRIKKEKRKDPLAHFLARPKIAEISAIQDSTLYVKETNAKVHFCHLTVAESVDIIKKARNEGIDITAETCPHYLLFTEEDITQKGVSLKLIPPIRKKSDQDRLWNGILDGTIEIITTDHCSFTIEEKDKYKEDIWGAPSGIPGLQLIFKVMYTEFLRRGVPLTKLAKVLSTNPARRFRLDHKKGDIKIGVDADLIILDPNKESIVSEDTIYGNSDYRAYYGYNIKGQIDRVLLRGKTIIENGNIIMKKGFGEFVEAKKTEY